MVGLRVSDNRRFLITDQGAPFFWLGDTAWELFHRLTPDEAERYLTTRARQGYTVVQAVALAEHEFEKPNRQGDLPLIDLDPRQPNEPYFAHVDTVIRRANQLGMYVALLPTWGDKWNQKWGGGPEIFTPENARDYGEYLGRRYREMGVIWLLGGDRPVETDAHRAVIEAMAEGVRAGDGGKHLIGFHPVGQQSSSMPFPDAAWLDFHMYQTGHSRGRDTWKMIEADYALQPPRPCVDGEPGYEDHPSDFSAENGYLDAADVRRFAYWAVFAGAFGHTYGCHDIWQFYDSSHKPISAARTDWREAIELDGARQMGLLRTLIEERPFESRIPDQSIIVGDPGTGLTHVQATRDADGTWAMVYFPSPRPVALDVRALCLPLTATWLDPATGECVEAGRIEAGGAHEFEPSAGGDRVLLLDFAG